MAENERQWAYELWVHLSDHVNQRCEPDEPDDCAHCRDAEVDCDDCRKLILDWEWSLSDEDGHEGESIVGPNPTHQLMRAALQQILDTVHPRDRVSNCGGPPGCAGCVARYALHPAAVSTEERDG